VDPGGPTVGVPHPRAVGVTDPRAAAAQAAAILEGGRSLVVSDFDGTIAALVTDPWSAAMVPAARRALRRLAAREDVEVVLLSGRTVEDLADRARIGGIDYLGDHGSQRAAARRGFRAGALRIEHGPVDPALREHVRHVVATVPALVPEPWLVVEDKGSAVTFHFRAAPDLDVARARVLAAVEAVDPAPLLVRSGGRRSVELRSVDASDKGRALQRLIDERRPEAIVLLGDDHTDLLAFSVLHHARSAGRVRGLAIAVAARPEVTAEVAPSADLVLGSAVHAARFLALLAASRGPWLGRDRPAGTERTGHRPGRPSRARVR
jgi:trehalose-phosphatase